MKDSAEPDVDCPVPIETLRKLNSTTNAADVLAIVRDYPEGKRVRLALFCYNRSHLRTLALTIASSVDPVRLAQLAGTMGEVLAAQCRASGLSFGTEPIVTGKPVKAKPKISLGGPV
jgi:hypothetical protein